MYDIYYHVYYVRWINYKFTVQMGTPTSSIEGRLRGILHIMWKSPLLNDDNDDDDVRIQMQRPHTT